MNIGAHYEPRILRLIVEYGYWCTLHILLYMGLFVPRDLILSIGIVATYGFYCTVRVLSCSTDLVVHYGSCCTLRIFLYTTQCIVHYGSCWQHT